MPVPQHALLAFGGTLNGAEEWTNTLRMVPNSGIDWDGLEDVVEDLLDQAVTDLSAFFATSSFATALKLTWVKLNLIDTDGTYRNKALTHRRDLATAVSGTATQSHPPQVSLVATLLTDAQRGIASKGRIYLAGLAQNATQVGATDGLIAASQATAYATQVATLITNLNNWEGLDAVAGGLDVSIVSDGGRSLVPTERKVTAVKVGRVLDTQQRRRRDFAESYTAAVGVS